MSSIDDLAPGQRWRDRSGDFWYVTDELKMWTTSPSTAISPEHVFATEGPLQLFPEGPQSGDKLVDRDGDVWTMRDNGLMSAEGQLQGSTSLDYLNERWGPLRPVLPSTCCTTPDDGAVDVDMVNHPPHYQTESGLEAIEVIEAFFSENYLLGTTFKYLARAGKKDDVVQDLEKARWYLDREIDRRKAAQ